VLNEQSVGAFYRAVVSEKDAGCHPAYLGLAREVVGEKAHHGVVKRFLVGPPFDAAK